MQTPTDERSPESHLGDAPTASRAQLPNDDWNPHGLRPGFFNAKTGDPSCPQCPAEFDTKDELDEHLFGDGDCPVDSEEHGIAVERAWFESEYDVDLPEDEPLFVRFGVHDAPDTYARIDPEVTITGLFPCSSPSQRSYTERHLDGEAFHTLAERWDMTVVDRDEYESKADLDEELPEGEAECQARAREQERGRDE